jgi:hypothetical protein
MNELFQSVQQLVSGSDIGSFCLEFLDTSSGFHSFQDFMFRIERIAVSIRFGFTIDLAASW